MPETKLLDGDMWVVKRPVCLETGLLEIFASELTKGCMGAKSCPQMRAEPHEKILSKFNPNFKPYSKLSEHEREELLKDKRGLASMLVSAYFLEEDDLHESDWGMDTDSCGIYRIDFDGCFYPLVYHYEGLDLNCIRNPQLLYSMPKAACKPDFNFSFISTHDLLNFPDLTDCFMTNWIPRNVIEALKYDEEFAQWKYFFFTKMLVITHEKLESLVLGGVHSGISDIVLHLKRKLLDLENILCHMPEYLEFLEGYCDMNKVQKHIPVCYEDEEALRQSDVVRLLKKTRDLNGAPEALEDLRNSEKRLRLHRCYVRLKRLSIACSKLGVDLSSSDPLSKLVVQLAHELNELVFGSNIAKKDPGGIYLLWGRQETAEEKVSKALSNGEQELRKLRVI